MIAGLYRHYKGGLYLGLFRTWESDNDAQRVRRVVYLSLRDFNLDDRTESEFLSDARSPHPALNKALSPASPHFKPRFKRILPPWQPRRSP